MKPVFRLKKNTIPCCGMVYFYVNSLYFSLFNNIFKAVGTCVKSFDFTFCKRKHNLVVGALATYNGKKTHCNIIYAVFAVKHC